MIQKWGLGGRMIETIGNCWEMHWEQQNPPLTLQKDTFYLVHVKL
jgi:hypothetical protein